MRCLSPDVQVLVHAGYELTEKDYRELFLLHERFAVQIPDHLRERVAVAGAEERSLPLPRSMEAERSLE